MTNSPIPATYERIAELPVVIDDYALELLSRRVSSGFRRFTTVFGARRSRSPRRGRGRDLRGRRAPSRFKERAPVLPLAGSWTLEAFSRHLDQLDTFPDRGRPRMRSRARTVAGRLRALRWISRCARPACRWTTVLGRVPAPVRFVVSLNLGPAPTCAPLLSRRAACACSALQARRHLGVGRRAAGMPGRQRVR